MAVAWTGSWLRHTNHASNEGSATALLIRTAQADAVAFVRLYGQLRPDVVRQLAAMPLGPADVAAVTNATFVEVWWFAGRWLKRETDALAWVRAIAARRAADRWFARSTSAPQGCPPFDLLATFDRQVEVELQTLLVQPPDALPAAQSPA
jgi:DNA-directed RNA polymerase specialized sigma24 family protein